MVAIKSLQKLSEKEIIILKRKALLNLFRNVVKFVENKLKNPYKLYFREDTHDDWYTLIIRNQNVPSYMFMSPFHDYDLNLHNLFFTITFKREPKGEFSKDEIVAGTTKTQHDWYVNNRDKLKSAAKFNVYLLDSDSFTKFKNETLVFINKNIEEHIKNIDNILSKNKELIQTLEIKKGYKKSVLAEFEEVDKSPKNFLRKLLKI